MSIQSISLINNANSQDNLPYSTSKIEDHMKKQTKLQQLFLDYVESADENDDNYFLLAEILNDIIIHQNTNDLIEFLHLLSIISNNHHRHFLFFEKIEKILILLKKSIKEIISETTIFNIFKNNKKILHFLFEEKIISPNKIFAEKLLCKKYKKMNYHLYFYPEIKPFIHDKEIDANDECAMNQENFEINRKIGENENIICKLIRNDLIDEFIVYVNKTNFSLKSKINKSIYETNPFLVDNTPTLIEYAAFFGSIQIFQYLQFNGVEIKSSIWLYAIHGNHPEIIHLLESLNIKPKNDDFKECFIEAIKCHHNDIANYLYDNFLYDENEKNTLGNDMMENKTKITTLNYQNEIINDYSNNFTHVILKYFNFEYFKEEELTSFNWIIYEICKYDYPSFLDILIQAKKEDFDLNSEFTITKKKKNVKNEFGITINYNYIEKYPTLLFAASKNENLYIIKILLSNPEIDVNVCMLECFWAHEIETNNHYHQNVIWWKNDFPDSKSNCKSMKEYFKINTPLNISIKNQNLEIIKLLLSHQKININIKSVAKIWCFDKNNSEEIKEKKYTSLITSIKKNNIEIIKLLLSNTNIEINDKSITKRGTIKSKYNVLNEVYFEEIESTALSFSIKNNKLEFVKLLLSQSNIDINCKIKDKFMLFDYDNSKFKGNYKMRNWIFDDKIKKRPILYEDKLSGEFEITKNAFHIAISKDNSQIFQLLLSRPEVNLNNNVIYKNNDDEYSETILHIAAQNGNFEIFKFLFTKLNIDINHKSMDLINCHDKEEKTLLHIAVQYNHLEIVQFLLLQQGIDINRLTSRKNSALHFAVGNNNYSENEKFSKEEFDNRALEILKLLISNPLIDVNAKKIDKIVGKNKYTEKTALYIAAKYQKINQFNILLSHPDIDASIPFIEIKNDKIKKRKPVLYEVVKKGNLIMFLDLLSSHSNIDINEKYLFKSEKKYFEMAPLHIALFNSHKEILSLILKHPKIDVNSRYLLQSENSNSWHKKFYFMKLEFIKGCAIEEHGTALHIAFRKMNYEFIQILLSNRNININESMVLITKDEKVYGLTPLHLAVSERNFEITKLLLSYPKINVNAKLDKIVNESKFKFSIFDIDIDMPYYPIFHFYYRFFPTLNDENLLEIRGMTPLHMAIEVKKLDIVKLLVKKSNIDINETMLMKLKNGEKTGITALHMVIEMKELEYVEILLKQQNININSIMKIKHLQNTYQVTPLHLAAIIKDKKIINKISLAGANFI